jgi:hypothetical protein
MAKGTVMRFPVRYVGVDAYVPGVPQCDMSVDQWMALPATVRAWALAGGLYEVDADLAAATIEESAQVQPASGECEPCQQ